jgi:hypothetical protein
MRSPCTGSAYPGKKEVRSMTFRRGLYASLLASLAAVIVFALAPSATAFDPTELSLAFDALNTYSPEYIDPPPNDGAHDYAVGGGQHGDFFIEDCSNSTSNCVNEGFSAHSGPAGQNPQGRVSATFVTPHPSKLRGPVICLDVHVNEAFILVMQQESGVEGFPQNEPFLLHVIDMGNPIMGTPPDRIVNRGPGDFTPPELSGFLYPCGFDETTAPLLRGNIVVRDVS